MLDFWLSTDITTVKEVAGAGADACGARRETWCIGIFLYWITAFRILCRLSRFCNGTHIIPIICGNLFYSSHFFTTCLFGDKSNSDLRWQLRMVLKLCFCVSICYIIKLFMIIISSLKLSASFLSSFLLLLCRFYTYNFSIWKKKNEFPNRYVT